MFDVAWGEMLIVGAVALVVVGPKDLPRVMREAGRWMNRARMMAGQFRNGFDQMIQESELEELRRQTLRPIDPVQPPPPPLPVEAPPPAVTPAPPEAVDASPAKPRRKRKTPAAETLP